MYSESNRRPSTVRANDEFLRRMIGGELIGSEIPAMNMDTPSRPSLPDYGNNKPACDGSIGNEGESTENDECPTHIHAPSLAMVYSPKQCWRNLLDLNSALENGTLFAELVMPWEGGKKHGETEVRTRR